MLVNYVFLDSSERKLFSQTEHNYLITTVQEDRPSYNSLAQSNKLKLTLNHPVKELFWAIRPLDNTRNGIALGTSSTFGARGVQRWGKHYSNTDYSKKSTRFTFNKDYFNFTGPDFVNNRPYAFTTSSLRLNQFPRFENASPLLLNKTFPSLYHSRTPDTMFYVYSFAMQPEGTDPSGSLNCSRLDTIELELVHSDNENVNASGGNRPESEVLVYAKTLNILTIKAGMAGIKYSN